MANILENIQVKLVGSYKVNRLFTKLYSLSSPSNGAKALFVFGCQRSGTTIIQEIIGLNFNVKSIGEGDHPYFHKEHGANDGRLLSDNQVQRFLAKEKCRFVLLKPLRDSQRLQHLLVRFPCSRALWVYRDYEAVIRSHMYYYDQAHCSNYRAQLDDLSGEHWISEVVPEDVLDLVESVQVRTLAPESVYALYWLVRNALYLDMKPKADLYLMNYDDLMSNTEVEISKLCDFLDLKYHPFSSLLVKNQLPTVRYLNWRSPPPLPHAVTK